MKIRTSHDYPPIPTRDHDWSAVTDDYDWAPDAKDCPRGFGATEIEAINDLVEQLIDEAQDAAYAEGRKDESEEPYRQALMAEGARTMERLRLERDDWKRKYEELLHERSSQAIPANPVSGYREGDRA
jgi:hypothetical protein